MGRFLALMLVLCALAMGATPAFALDPTQAVNAGTSPNDWFNQQQQQNPGWSVTSKISPAMSQILSQVLIDFGGYTPRNVCQGAAASQAWQALADAANSGPLEAFLDAIKGSLSGIKDLATFGVDPSSAADVLDAQTLTQQAFDKAKDMGKDAGKDYLKDKLREIWKGKKVEVLKRSETRGPCETLLVATYDEGAGTYEIVIYGSCNCSAVGGWALGSAGTALKTFAVTLTGTITPAINDGAGVFIIGMPKISVVANCGCGANSSTAVPPPGGSGTTGLTSMPTSDGYAKVTTACKECQPIVDKIHAAAAARQEIENALRSLSGQMTQAQNELAAATTDAAKAAAQAQIGALKQQEYDLQWRDQGLQTLEKRLWADLKDCEKKCGHASTGYCPGPGGEYALAPRQTDGETALESAVLSEINAARADPAAFAQVVRANADGANTADAVAFLEHQAPVASLTENTQLDAAAVSHAADQGCAGKASHTGSDGSTATQRMQAVGIMTTVYSEVISIAQPTAAGVVSQLIIDLPGPAHPHRTDLFDPMLKVAGVGCGPNKTYGAMCVIDMTAAPMEASPGT